MFAGLPEQDGALAPAALDAALAAVARADAVVLGPGLGRSDRAGELARERLARIEVPLVIDADGLNALAGRLDELSARAQPTVLTPRGELGRLLEVDTAEIGRAAAAPAPPRGRSNSSSCSRATTRSWQSPSGLVAVSRGGAPALATAGTATCSPASPARCSPKGLAPERRLAAVHAHLRAGQLAAAPHRPTA